jgi:hypothetical protein
LAITEGVPSIRLALVGGGARSKITVANYLRKKRDFKVVRLDDGVKKMVRDMYMYRPHQRVVWERRFDIYDALYKIDSEIHINYLLHRMDRTGRSVVTPDPRYVNEVVKLQRAGFVLVRVSEPPNYKRNFLGVRNAQPGTVLLQEAFGQFDIYSVDYSIMGGDRLKLIRAVDIIVEKERAKLVDAEREYQLELSKTEELSRLTLGE